MDGKNTSGHGDYSDVPEDIKKWNWGAFWLTWVWGIGNKCYVALFGLIPIVNIFVRFYLGKNGNELAWRATRWHSEEALLECQRKWRNWAWIIVSVLLVIHIVGIVQEVRGGMQNIEIEQETIRLIKADKTAMESLRDDFQLLIFDNTSRHGFGMNQVSGRMYILKSDGDIYWVKVYREDNKIVKIIIERFGDDEKDKGLNILTEIIP